MKIHLICENFRNRVKSCPLSLFPSLILDNHRDWVRFYQDSGLFFLDSSLFILKWSLAAVVTSRSQKLKVPSPVYRISGDHGALFAGSLVGLIPLTPWIRVRSITAWIPGNIHDHTHVLFNSACGCHWKLLQNPAQITSLAPLWAGASVCMVRSYHWNLKVAPSFPSVQCP